MPAAPSAPRRILVVKHGALGDIVLATGPFRSIRAAHPKDHIVLLTGTPYAGFLTPAGLFDEIWIDDRPPASAVATWWRLLRRLRRARFDRVYDLQHSDRTHLIFRALRLGRTVEWSGIAPGCSHPHANPARDAMHTVERQAEQLAAAGIAATPPTDLSWVDADVSRFGLPENYVLLVPGGSAHRPDKRWPVAHYARLAAGIAARGATPVLLGAAAESALLADLAARVPAARNLGGETSFAEIVALARRARGAVGNDTGPMHLIAAAPCPAVVLFSHASAPAQTAPRGPSVAILQRNNLADLDPADVEAALVPLLRGG